MSEQISRARIEALWKKCGIKPIERQEWYELEAPNGDILDTYPALTLDNLERYVFPVVNQRGFGIEMNVNAFGDCRVILHRVIMAHGEFHSKSLKIALFLACEKAVEQSK
jgi:hypothetical protein